jgi:carboxypeptidase T
VPYLTVDEVESALAVAAAPPNQGFTELIALPHLTWEGRQCHAIKIGAGGGDRCGVYLLGGIHAREWGSPDILINLVEKLCSAYRTNSGLTFGPQTYSAQDVQSIVDTIDLFVFPQANPDGRYYSMTVDPMWRKNRRPAPANHPNCPGVDINRNYDWLWNFPQYFSAQAPVVSSTDPCDETYIGPAAASEPETKNVVWLLDNRANIAYFMDIHSFSEDLLYTWGDDDDQAGDPNMNFRNHVYDGKRGITVVSGLAGASAYAEYIDPADLNASFGLASQVASAIKTVRGRTYKVVQSASGLYVTSGTSDDYCYSRHLSDPSKAKVFSYTMEWGRYNPQDVAGSFHPPYAEMKKIIEETTAGLVQFCLGAVAECRPRFDFDWRRFATAVSILFGVVQDGGGVVWPPGGPPVPIGPWGPLAGKGLSPEARDGLLGIAVRELASLVGEQELRRSLDQLGARLALRAAQKMLQAEP